MLTARWPSCFLSSSYRLFSARFSKRTITVSLLFMVSIIGLWAGSIYVPTAVTQIALREGRASDGPKPAGCSRTAARF